ncbi:hypothetical protein [Anaerotignum sp.]|uniref:hypothetical protein n=1 Tax=Anaerotignum sp. TaxID=2039241 RepID=UPI002896E611|nr:hypothetical protein [Anaerotignum sp.]
MNDKNFIGMGHNPSPNVPDIPEGFAMALLQEPDAKDRYESLDDMQKARVICYIQSNTDSGCEAKEKINVAINSLKNNNLNFTNGF